MSVSMLRLAEALAYGPFLLMLGLYGLAVALRSCGQPALLAFLVEHTKERAPIQRAPSSTN